METETIEYVLPVWTLPALINGDLSGLEDSEVNALDALHVEIDLHACGRHYHWSATEDESFFSWRNDLQGLHGNQLSDVIEVNLVYMGTKKE